MAIAHLHYTVLIQLEFSSLVFQSLAHIVSHVGGLQHKPALGPVTPHVPLFPHVTLQGKCRGGSENWRRTWKQQTGELKACLTLLRTLWYISRKTSSRARVKASALVTLSSRPAPMCSRKLHTDMPSSRSVASCSIRSSSSFPSHSWLIAVENFFRRYSNCKSKKQC